MSVDGLILNKVKGLYCLNRNFRDVIEILINMKGPTIISHFSFYSKFLWAKSNGVDAPLVELYEF